MQSREPPIGDPSQPKQSFYGGQNTIYNSLQGSHLSPSAATHHSSSHNVNPTTRAQQLYVAAIDSSLGSSSPSSARSGLTSGQLPTSPTSLASPYAARGTQIMSRMCQPPGSPTSQIYYHHQHESSFSMPESPQTAYQGPISTDISTGPQQSALYTQPSSQQQHAQTTASNIDAFGNSTNSTRSSASFKAGLNLGSQISVASLPVQHDSLTVGHPAPKAKALSGKLGKVSKNVAKLALRVAGTSSATSAIDTPNLPVPAEASVSFVDVVASLINRYALRDRNSLGISRADLEAVFQSAPNAKYEEVIRALMIAQVQQQKMTGTSPTFNIQVLIDELRRLQSLANVRVRATQGQAYPPFGQIGVMELTCPGFMNNVSHPQSAQVPPEPPEASTTHVPGMSTFPEHAMASMTQAPGMSTFPGHAMYSQGSGTEPYPPHIAKNPTSWPQFQSSPSQLGSMPLPTYQMNAASGARLYRELGGATDMLDDQDVSNNREASPASLHAELMQQQAQLQMTLLQQHHQMTLLQQQQQQIMHILLEQQMQKQDTQAVKEVERTLSADISSTKAFIGSRPDSRNEVTSLPLPLT